MTATLTPPLEVTAEVFHRRMGSGRNGAVLLSARGADDVSVLCVVKPPGLTDNPALHPVPSLLEWLGATIGRALSVVVPASFKVLITEDFANSVKETGVVAGLKQSVGAAVYGSQHLVAQPMTNGGHLDPSLRGAAAGVLAFDVFVHNIDRRLTNPNLLTQRAALVAIDHGDAFSFLYPVLFAPDPVSDHLPTVLREHACVPAVRAWNRLSFEEFRRLLAGLTDERLEQIQLATPAEWREGPASGKLELVVDTLRRRRDAVDTWLPEVERWLQSK